jgi:hypothetical protein
MRSYKFAFVLIASLLTGNPAMAQGGAGAGGAGSGGTGASTGGGGTGKAPGSGQAGTQERTQNNASGSPTDRAEAEKNAAVNGTKTTSEPGATSAPGVGVGHAANGLPIGAPGSGLGSPEHPVDGRVEGRP